ncbi:MAG TPA: YIP1 family protein [Gemmatimonadales bacterium]|nr:YIP1 family protein [Gemmatimonadales bacterium]
MTAPVSAAPVPIWEDFLEIFYAPRAVFTRRATSGFWLPLLIMFAVSIALFFGGRGLLQPMYDAEFDRAMAVQQRQNPAMTQEQVDKGRQIATKFTTVIIPVVLLVAPLVIGFFLWIAGKFVGARQELEAACMVAVYAMFPRVLEGLTNLLQAAVVSADTLTSRYALQLGPARFIDPDAHFVLLTILGRFDLITLWCTGLLALGLSVTGKIELKKALIGAGIVWLLPGLWGVWGAVRAAG